MGHCSVFDCQIAPGCDQPMEAHENLCSCPECGAVCTGRYEGCPDVWATATVALVPPPRRRGRKRKKAAARKVAPAAAPASVAWTVDEIENGSAPETTESHAERTDGDAVPTHEHTEPTNGDAVPTDEHAGPTNGNAVPANGDTTSGGNGDATHDGPESEFDEGLELLRGALADIHQERERHEAPRGLSGTPRARRPRPEPANGDANAVAHDQPPSTPDSPYRKRGKRDGDRNGNGNGNGKNGKGNGWREKQRGEPGTKPVPARRRGRDRGHAGDGIAVEEAKADPGTKPERNADLLKAAAEELARNRDQSAPVVVPPRRARRRARGKSDPATKPPTAAPKVERAELPPAAPHTEVAPVTTARAASKDRRRWAIVAAAILAAVALFAGGVVALSSLGGDSDSANETATPRPAPTSSRLELGTFAVVDGVDGERVWALSGPDGTEFEGTLTFANETDAPVAISHTEIIPKSLAASVDQIRFSPQPIVIDPDPVVQFDLTVPADDTVTASYSIEVPPDGADRSRLADWASDLQDEQRRRGAPVTTVPTLPGDTSSSSGSGGGGGSGNKPGGGGNANKPSSGSSPKPAAPPTAAPAPAPPPPQPPPPPPPPASGTIVIRVVSYEGTGTFGFSGPGGGVSVTTSGSPNGNGQSAAMSVSPGTYAWTQVSVAPGYHLQVIDCTDRDAGPFEQRSTVSGATATFNVQPGESVTCTWINRR